MDETAEFDLFGNPVGPARDPRGRPSFAKTKENQMVVISLRASGFSHKEIAAFMKCDEKTLRKHFSRELEHGAMFLEGMAVQVLVQRMLEGSIPAATKVREIARPRRSPGPVRKDAADKLGKKAQAIRDARSISDNWADLLGPDDKSN